MIPLILESTLLLAESATNRRLLDTQRLVSLVGPVFGLVARSCFVRFDRFRSFAVWRNSDRVSSLRPEVKKTVNDREISTDET
jgi:hypothetical protein